MLVPLGRSKVHTPWAGAPYLQLQPGQQADIVHRTLGLLINDLDPVWSGGAQGGSQGLISQPQVPCSHACFAGRPRLWGKCETMTRTHSVLPIPPQTHLMLALQVAFSTSPDRYFLAKVRLHRLYWLCRQSSQAGSEQEWYLWG